MTAVKSIDDPRYVKAMSHPLRVRIVALLTERVASPNQISELLDASLGTVAYHVRTLDQLSMIELVDETRVRGAVEHHYRALPLPSFSPEQWADARPIAKQAALASSLDLLAQYAQAAAAAGGFDGPSARLRRSLIRLDAKGMVALSRACERLLEQADKIEAASAERVAAKPETPTSEVGLGLLLFEAVRLSQNGHRT